MPIIANSHSTIAVLIHLRENANYSHLRCNRMSMVRLSELAVGQHGTIEEVEAEEPFRQRLRSLGFRIGKEVRLIRQALFGGPLQVRVGSVNVMLRRNDAALIRVWSDG